MALKLCLDRILPPHRDRIVWDKKAPFAARTVGNLFDVPREGQAIGLIWLVCSAQDEPLGLAMHA